jgi:hypothetical protein
MTIAQGQVNPSPVLDYFCFACIICVNRGGAGTAASPKWAAGLQSRP